jgi:hypothetical protein
MSASCAPAGLPGRRSSCSGCGVDGCGKEHAADVTAKAGEVSSLSSS